MKIPKVEATSTVKKKHMLRKEIFIQSEMRHKHICKLISHFEIEDRFYIIMELSSHGDMKKLITKRKTLSEIEVRYFT